MEQAYNSSIDRSMDIEYLMRRVRQFQEDPNRQYFLNQMNKIMEVAPIEYSFYQCEGFKYTLKSPYKDFFERVELELSLYEKYAYSDILTNS